MSLVHLNATVRHLGRSATLAINERSAALEAAGRRIWRLGLGQSPFPVPAPAVEALRAHAAEKDYLPVQGLPALREAIAAWHRRRQGLACTGDDVLVGPGSKELLFLLQLVYHGDLCIPAPSWVSYGPQARIIGRQITWIPTRAEDGWMVTADAVDQICAREPEHPRLLILNAPSNPTGRSLPSAALQALAEVARARKLVVVSDEIYGELHHSGGHETIARHYPEGTIISNGLSKWCGAGGWRLGWFLVPPTLRGLLDAMAAVASETYTSVAAPVQYAAVRAVAECPIIEAQLQGSRRILEALGARLATILRAGGARVAEPEGGFYLFPDFAPARARLAARGITDCAQLCERALEEIGVAFLPGSRFGRAPRDLTARLAYVNFDGAAALGALGDGPIDEAWLRTHCGSTLEAVERVADWIAR